MNFAASLPGAFAWPFRRPVRVAVWLSLSLAIAALRWMPWLPNPLRRGAGAVPLALAFAVAAAASYLFAVLRRSTHAPTESLPETFRNEVDFDHALQGLVEFLGALLVAYLPLGAFAAYATLQHPALLQDPAFRGVLFAFAAAGTLYLPMVLLLLGFSGDWRSGFNLALGVRSAVRLGSDYALCAAVFALPVATAWTLETFWVAGTVPGSGGAFAARSTASLAEFGLAIVAVRALGLLYSAREGDLGWEARRET